MANSWKRQSSVAYLVKYEDLVQNPAGTLDGILEYLGLETSDPEKADLLSAAFAQSEELRNHRTTESIEASLGRWKRDLDPSLHPVVQDAFGEFLAEFGYE
jgi:hypothetical protein